MSATPRPCRPKRAVPVELTLTLDMFPPGHSCVLTPRTDGTQTWCSVLAHKVERGFPPMLMVHPDGDRYPSYVTFDQIRKCIQREGLDFEEFINKVSEPSSKKGRVGAKSDVTMEVVAPVRFLVFGQSFNG